MKDKSNQQTVDTIYGSLPIHRSNQIEAPPVQRINYIPGPMKFVESATVEDMKIFDEPLSIVNERGHHVASVYSSTNTDRDDMDYPIITTVVTREEAVAHATLFAAAPRMLYVLEAICAYLSADTDYSRYNAFHIEQIKIAIAEAKGKNNE